MSCSEETKWEYGSPIYKALAGEVNGVLVKPEQAVALFKPSEDGSVPDAWLTMVERYKHRITRYSYSNENGKTERHKLSKEICEDLFRIVKPCTTTEVPIGTLMHDKYKYWYR